mmetsp:Transcript_24589/g.80583  ORF Transcript_24589/g.80583 Transcript_24589/m.80583 type:complete len:115 (-) Transcript_24589:1082-1426(-)
MDGSDEASKVPAASGESKRGKRSTRSRSSLLTCSQSCSELSNKLESEIIRSSQQDTQEQQSLRFRISKVQASSSSLRLLSLASNWTMRASTLSAASTLAMAGSPSTLPQRQLRG